MSSNQLMMGYGGGDLLRTGAVWPTVCSLPRSVCAGCGQWPVWPAAPGPWRERIRGGLTAGLTTGLRHTRRCAIQIDSLYLFCLLIILISCNAASAICGATFSARYHPGIWLTRHSKFSCCDSINKRSEGCQTVTWQKSHSCGRGQCHLSICLILTCTNVL